MQTAMQGIGGTIQRAEDILSGVVRDANGNPAPGIQGAKPTASGIGSLYDSAASLVGASPSGAKEADELKVLGGSLVSKVPRMQGPQSDKDVLLYKEMAGQVGNDKLPVDRRYAALQEVKRLYAKYENLNQPDRRSGPPPGAVVPIP